MTYLFGAYDNISDQKLHEERIKTTQHNYVHSNPVANFFNIIHKYATMSESHSNPETEEQIIRIGTIIITNAHIFSDAIKKWNLTPAANKTWKHFKSHLTIAQTNYKKDRPTKTIESQGYINHAIVVQGSLKTFIMPQQANTEA